MMSDVDGSEKRPDLLKGRFNDRHLWRAVCRANSARCRAGETFVIASACRTVLREAGLGAETHFIGYPNDRGDLRIRRNAKMVFEANMNELLQVWSEVSHEIAGLRDDVESADQEIRGADRQEPNLGLSMSPDLRSVRRHRGSITSQRHVRRS